MNKKYKLSKPIKLAPYFTISGLDSEKGEQVTRVVGTVMFGLYIALSMTAPVSHQLLVAFSITVIFLFYGVLLLYGQFDRWLRLVPRRFVSVILDQAFYAAVLYTAGELTALFLFAPICMSLGAGLRYGRGYAVVATTASSVFTVAALMNSTYWQHTPTFATAFAVAVCIIPFYIFRLTDPLAVTLRTDFMTKIANRRGYNEKINDLCQDAGNDAAPAALIFLDLDGFKSINDGDNHAAGDAILVAAAACLVARLSTFGTPARLGGDEFAVTVDNLENQAQLESAIDKVLLDIREIGRCKGYQLSASIGLFYFSTALPVTKEFAETAADALLYQSKNSGKNQCSTSIGRHFTADGKLVTPADKSEFEAVTV